MKTININTTGDNFTTLWLVLWQGALDLTPRERSVLAAILDKYLELEKDGLKPPYIYKMCFDSDARKEYCEKLEISSFNLTNTLSGLKSKGAITEESKGVYGIAEQVIPHREILFKFV